MRISKTGLKIILFDIIKSGSLEPIFYFARPDNVCVNRSFFWGLPAPLNRPQTPTIPPLLQQGFFSRLPRGPLDVVAGGVRGFGE